MAVPGWPLPAASTASMARTRAVATALASRSVQARSLALLTTVDPLDRPEIRAYPPCSLPPAARVTQPVTPLTGDTWGGSYSDAARRRQLWVGMGEPIRATAPEVRVTT